MKNLNIGGCEIVDVVRTTTEGLAKRNVYKLLREMKSSDGSNLKVVHVKDKKYRVENGAKHGIMEVPENITKLGLLVFFEYLKKNPRSCEGCCLSKGNSCPKIFLDL